MARAATTSDAFNAIAEVQRREILGLLAEQEHSVGDLLNSMEVTQPQVSKHLRVLREVGLVEVREDGRLRWYRVNAENLKPIYDSRPSHQIVDQRIRAWVALLNPHCERLLQFVRCTPCNGDGNAFAS
ncbi:ArsR/SmtB family transcription factor [Neorhodopirellula lusitana]|uniref:ArsR/SmtB family transcription factor n=1 Tax=Neorhodopirellula lusitana TaxID=445327 RepID=UPI00385031EA